MTLMKPSAQFQIGKKGVTSESIQALNKILENHKQVRISMLPSSGRTSKNIKQTAEYIASMLSRPVYLKIIGFTIIILRKGAGHDSSKTK